MSIIDDFKDINRRMNRKPEPVAKADVAQAFPYNAFARSIAAGRITGPKTGFSKTDDELRVFLAGAVSDYYTRMGDSQRYGDGLQNQQSVPTSCSFRDLSALIKQYDRDDMDCAAKRPRGI